MKRKRYVQCEGFTCECGSFRYMGEWLLAHWPLSTLHTCPECGNEHHLIDGEVILLDPMRRRLHTRLDL